MKLYFSVAILLWQHTALSFTAPTDDTAAKKDRLDRSWQDHSREDFCNKYKKNPEATWKTLGVGKWLDSWLENTKENTERWTEEMDMEVHNNGRSSIVCQTMEDNCESPDDCFFHYDNGMGPAYWVLYSMARFHEGLAHLRNELREGNYKAVLSVDKMVDAFGLGDTSDTDFNTVGLLSGAFTVAAGAMVAVNPAAGLLTAIAGVFGVAGSLGSDEAQIDYSIDLEQQVYQAYDIAIKRIDRVLELVNTLEPPSEGPKSRRDINVPFVKGVMNSVMGVVPGLKDSPAVSTALDAVGTIVQGPDVFTGLPNQVGDYDYALTRFFAEGKFLGDNMVEKLEDLKKEYIRRHQQALSATIIKQMNYFIAVPTNIDKAKDCKWDNVASPWFDEENKRCFLTMRKNYNSDPIASGHTLISCDGPSLHAEDRAITVARDEYELDLKEFYTNAYTCGDKHRDGNGRAAEAASEPNIDGHLPECFFNVPVVVGNFNDMDIRVSDVKWNTTSYKKDCSLHGGH